MRAALNLKGVVAPERHVGIEGGEHRGPAFLKFNPIGAIPALIDHGPGPPSQPLKQSQAILEFLDEVDPRPPLRPADPQGRARAFAGGTAGSRRPPADHAPDQEVPDDERRLRRCGLACVPIHGFTAVLQALEPQLANESHTGGYGHGDVLTRADICPASLIAVMRVFKTEVPDLPTVDRLMAACEQLDALARAEPRRAGDPPR